MNASYRGMGCTGLLTLLMGLWDASLPAGFAEPSGGATVQPSASSPAPATTLTNILSIMGLSREMAAQEVPVEVEGVVTCVYSHDAAFFINDGQAGVYVDNTPVLGH